MSKYTELEDWRRPVTGIKYVTTKPITWHVGHKHSDYIYTVPHGFIFEASIPFFLRIIFNPHDLRFHKAAALHDHMMLDRWDSTADATFNEALKADGVSSIKRLFMYLAVIVNRQFNYDWFR